MSDGYEQGTMTAPPQFLDGERAILGGLLIDNKALPGVLANLSPDDFYREAHRSVYKTIADLSSRNEPVDWVTLTAALKEAGLLESIGGPAFLVELVDAVPSAANIEHYASVVKDKSLRRQIMGACREGLACSGTDTSVDDVITGLQRNLLNLVTFRQKNGPRQFKHINRESFETLDKHMTEETEPGLKTGFTGMDNQTGGLRCGDLVIVCARPSMGKAQPLTSHVLLKSGIFKSLGDVEVGDCLASIDDKTSVVLRKTVPRLSWVYEVLLSDGRRIEADENHLWNVVSSRWKTQRQLTTLEIQKTLSKVRYQGRLHLLAHGGDFGSVSDIGIDPWLLGFLLGDGCLTHSGVRFSNPEPYIRKRVEKASGLTLKGSERDNCDGRCVYARGVVPNPLREQLKKLGVSELYSYERFIPGVVFQGTKAVREQVLAGLLESDGWIEKCGAVVFQSSSEQLVDGVVNLVHSLGGAAKKRKRPTTPAYYKNGQKTVCRDAYLTAVSLNDLSVIIQSPRLLSKFKRRKKSASPCIVAVTKVRQDLTRCITVSHSSGCYITDAYVVTHNSAYAANVAVNVALQGKLVLIFSLEMQNGDLWGRIIAKQSLIPFWYIRNASLSKHDLSRIVTAVGDLDELPLWIDDSPSLSPGEVLLRTQAVALEQKTNPALVVIDYLQIMRPDEKTQNREREVASMSAACKSMAKQLDCPVILLSQLNREVTKRKDQRPQLSDLRESGAVEQDADVVIGIYRKWPLEQIDANKTHAEIGVLKQRNGPIGWDTDVEWDPNTVSFRDKRDEPDQNNPPPFNEPREDMGMF